ncbi:hypothetical protein HG531_006389 [Fusarium graminearum]|nr:hypothetical protein HG531_006389 [Fusarium graminearum]
MDDSWHRSSRRIAQFRHNNRDVLVPRSVEKQAEPNVSGSLRVNLVVGERVNRHTLGEVDGLAQSDDTNTKVNGFGGKQNLGGLGEVGSQRTEIGRVGDVNASSGELLCEIDADTLIRIVDKDNTEVLLELASLEKGALNEVVMSSSDAVTDRKCAHVLSENQDSRVNVLVGVGHVYAPGHRQMAEAVWYRRLVVLDNGRTCWSNGKFCAAVLLILSVLLRLCLASLALTTGLLVTLRWALWHLSNLGLGASSGLLLFGSLL